MKVGWMGLMAVGTIVCLTSCTGRQQINTTETITIGGSSEAYEVMEVLTDAYQEKTKNIQFKILPSSQTSGGVQGVKDGVLDIGLTSRKLIELEKTDLIKYRAFANIPMLLVTDQSASAVSNITGKQLKAIYSGEINNWQQIGGADAKIILLDLPEDESEKQLLRQHYLGEIKITTGAIVFFEDSDLIEVLQTTPYSIGPVPKEEKVEELPVNILTIDGIAATPENIRNGQYKLVYTIGIVFAAEPTPATQDFINYIFSEAGQQELAAAGYVVSEQP